MFVAMGMALVLCSIMMFLVWLYYLQTDNPSIVDVAWSLNVGMGVYATCVFLSDINIKSLLIIAVALAWSLRLTGYLGVRNLGGEEDGRYIDIKKRWAGPKIHWKFLGFFQLQALIDFFLISPFIFMLFQPGPAKFSDFVFFGLAMICVIGEAVADFQLSHFKKKNNMDASKVYSGGLWKYSRHPNYFFELSYWVIVYLWSMQYQWGVVFVIVPAMMMYFILKVTGIPETEAQNLRSKGEEYRLYIMNTSPLIPWFPKRRT